MSYKILKWHLGLGLGFGFGFTYSWGGSRFFGSAVRNCLKSSGEERVLEIRKQTWIFRNLQVDLLLLLLLLLLLVVVVVVVVVVLLTHSLHGAESFLSS